MKINIRAYSVIFLVLTSLNVVFCQERKVVLLEEGWRFKTGEILNEEKSSFDDTHWDNVIVPHDWAIRGNFNLNLDNQKVRVNEDGDKVPELKFGRTGALPFIGVGWYRRVLPIDETDKNKQVFLEFDGAMSLAKIYVNGVFVGERPYGYSSFSFDISNYIQQGVENVLAVRLENKTESSRWYPGAGIYRNVRLVTTNKTHIVHWGTFITTPRITEANAEINIRTEIVSDRFDNEKVVLLTEVFSNTGKKVASVTSNQKINNQLSFSQQTQIKNPELWSNDSPTLYKVVSKVFVNSILMDEYTTAFGCRTIRFDKENGFFLNEKPLKIKGVCVHHDLGPLGAAVNYRATERQMQIMKEMGVNAIRTSHNPPSPELLQICDSLGIMVMEEAFDEWKNGKNANGYAKYFDDWSEKDIRSMIQRDRNHPSIIIWSIGNEIREQRVKGGKEIAARLANICRSEDLSRPITAGFNLHNFALTNGLADSLDLVGFNYKPFDYKNKHLQYPKKILFGSETASTVSSRGEYKFPAIENRGAWYNDYQVSSYDLDFPAWGSSPDIEFEAQDACKFICGEFVWTGFDYLGEPTPYNQATPSKSSYFGIVDLAGLKKDRFYLYQSNWSKTPVLHLLPHWNWPDRLNQNVPVFCYTNYPKAELFVNGKSMGIKKKDTTNSYSRYRLMWKDVVYQPGEIKVVAYNDDGKAVAQEVIKTAGEPYGIKLTADKRKMKANGKDLSFVTVEVVDKDGNLCPRASNLVFFEASGTGHLKALCNGNPIDQTSFASNYMNVFNGKMVAVIESEKDNGNVSLMAFGGRLKSAMETMQVEK